MSLDATRWAWKQQVRPAHKLVLLSLADRAGEQHECRPSVKRLETDTGLHRVTIMDAIYSLEESGLLQVSRSLGRGNTYRLIGVEGRHDLAEKAVRKTAQVQGRAMDADAEPVQESALVQESAPVRKTAQDQCTKPHSHQCGKPHSESTNEPTKNRRAKNSPAGGVEVALPDWLPADVFNEFVLHRKQVKSPLTQRAAELAVKELEKLRAEGHDPVRVVEQSVLNGWKGLFALKAEPAKPARLAQAAAAPMFKGVV